MSQSFSLYSELTVRQNLVLHARLFRMPEAEIPARGGDGSPFWTGGGMDIQVFCL